MDHWTTRASYTGERYGLRPLDGRNRRDSGDTFAAAGGTGGSGGSTEYDGTASVLDAGVCRDDEARLDAEDVRRGCEGME